MLLRLSRYLLATLALVALVQPMPASVGMGVAAPGMQNEAMTGTMMTGDAAPVGMAPMACKDCDGRPMMSDTCVAQCQIVPALVAGVEPAMMISLAEYAPKPVQFPRGVPRAPDPSPPRSSAIT
jgi:hypothetical protein